MILGPFIGIWWYTDDKEIWARIKPKGMGDVVHNHSVYDKEEDHSTLWKDVVEEHLDRPEELIRAGYDVLEYGSVEYNFLTDRYEIICSGVFYDADFRKKILNHFNLLHAPIEFVLRVD